MQLVAYGAQDIYLTGNPQITFFKVVYRRHTNFSMEAIQQTWNGTSSAADGRCTATISRNGDLVHRMYIEFVGGANTNCVDNFNPSSHAIKSVELEIGGQRIDKHTGDWMETWAQLTEKNPSGTVSAAGAAASGTLFQKMSGMGGYDVAGGNPVTNGSFMVPLQFWFCRNPGLALPLIALQYHEVKVILDHRIVTSIKTDNIEAKLWADYIYLDTDERRRFAQVSHEYLIEQVQEQSLTGLVNGAELNFNHPVKELVWRAGTSSPARGDNDKDSGGPSALQGTAYKLKLNGHDRFAARDFTYFTRTQVLEHHSGAGGLDSDSNSTKVGNFNDSIGVYSFALKPEEHQPSGTCNFSRIDNAQLESGQTDTNALVFAVNYNVLRIMSGMGGLAYSN